jgi:imidazole glycerol-phosphate synthase subunit HisF
MLQTRIIPCLLLKGESLVKTIKFSRPSYIGDPINTVRIFNDLEVDELIFLDIEATKQKRGPDYKILTEIANECFMPLSYGGGIRTLEDIRKIFYIGFEKISINTYAFENNAFIREASRLFGNQSIIVSIDVRKNIWGRYEVCTEGGNRKTRLNPVEYALKMEEAGAGELLLTSIDLEGTWSGMDVDLIQEVTESVSIPVIAQGGAGTLENIGAAVKLGRAAAVALGSMVVYQAKGMGVLVNFPDRENLEKVLT